MTLADGSGGGAPIVLSNMGAGTATVTMTLNGSAGSTKTVASGSATTLVWVLRPLHLRRRGMRAGI